MRSFSDAIRARSFSVKERQVGRGAVEKEKRREQSHLRRLGLLPGARSGAARGPAVRGPGAQCGYCIPGILLTAQALLDQEPDPTRARIAESLGGNLCRCTGYLKIFEAIELAAARMRGEEVVHG